jgi:hypothetical protein
MLACAVLVGSALAAPTSDKPDLTAELPTNTPLAVSTYVDRYAKPGTVLYRFPAVIRNLGGAMDLYMQGGHAYQAIHAGGTPSVKPDPNRPPTGAGVTIEDRSARGASFIYSNKTGHNHWHFQQAAQYALLLPGGGQRLAGKVGFCMYDSWAVEAGGAKSYYAPGVELYHLELRAQNLAGSTEWRASLNLYNAWRMTLRWGDEIQSLSRGQR